MTSKLRRRWSSGDLPSTVEAQTKPEFLPSISEQHDELNTEDSGSEHKRHSLESKSSSTDENDGRPLPANSKKLKRSDSKKSFSGMISKIMKQNRTTKLWKEEATATKLSFKKNKPKFFRSISLTSDRKKGFFESRSVSADLGYESSDTIHTTNYHDSSEEDEEECNYCYCCERRTFRRSMSAPVPGTQGSDVQSQKKACRHWQWYLRSSSSNWHNFNTHNFYCY